MTEKRPMSTKAKVITGIIYALAVALLATVIYLNVNGSKNDEYVPADSTTTTTSTLESTTNLPYNPTASDKYADIEPVYTTDQVTLQKDENGIWCAYVDGAKATTYTGVAKNEKGWFFVRDGEVDFNYNGIAGNEKGKWYIKDGYLDASFSGNFSVNGTDYTIENGRVVD